MRAFEARTQYYFGGTENECGSEICFPCNTTHINTMAAYIPDQVYRVIHQK